VTVTGAGNGIGRGVAIAFTREGATVYGIDLDSAGLETTAEHIGTGRGRFIGLNADVSKPEAISRSIEEILRESGRADVLVNNAGINMAKRIADLEISDWDKVFDTNLKSTYLFCKGFWPTFRAQKAGVILNVSSVMGQVGGIGSPAYCSTKAAIIMLSRCLAKDGAQYGIRVNTVCPGYIDTPIMERALQVLPDPERARRELIGRMPLGRMGSPADIAAGMLFLASAEAAYISGTELTIDGAVTATQID
jgi:NAD(P)-dependent dehydrogenase (short-subunit alcohol dehydrogenase family)